MGFRTYADTLNGDRKSINPNFDKTKARYDSNPRFNSFDKLKPKQEHDDRSNSKNESANKVKSNSGFERMKYNNFESRKSKFCFNCADPNHVSRFCIHKDLNALGVEPSDIKLQNVIKRILNQK
ncbi:hypothetical protein AVEN_23135-1 [Araneus ventricosus]|uniref:CCHC-type domain-containing protein n=1 Tax=Araneus ventricosus TaxID=182803 RepID=A0A4Y2BND6_ARAVE|nr:hypothetical protein AVEN_23135-1 [Araneus ventricosus]